MAKVQRRVIEERFGKIEMLGIFIPGFANAGFIKLVNSSPGVANKHWRMCSDEELGPATFIKFIYN